MTIGGTNSSLYTGNINYISLTQAQYWMIPMTSMSVQGGQPITLSGVNQNAVIDTGTTLIGGPKTILDQLYSQVSGATRGSTLSSALADYYLIREYTFNPFVCLHILTSETLACTTKAVVSLTFGGIDYQISSQDFIVDQVSTSYCLAAFFVLELNSGSSPIPGQSNSNHPTWVVGDSFLKNVYTIFRSEPPSVGFANLSSISGAIGFAGTQISNGTTTIVKASGNSNRSSSSSISFSAVSSALFGAVVATIVGLSL